MYKQKNNSATTKEEFLSLPSNAVVELGSKVEI